MKHKLLEKISPHKAPTGDLPVEYIITTSHEVVEGSKILFVSFWSDANRIKAKYKLFIDSSKEQYSTQILLDDGGYKWSGACLYNIIDYGWRHIVTGCDMSEDIIRIEDYLDCGTIANGEEIYKALRNYQQNIMDKKLKTRHKHITDKIDAVMDKVPALPDNFEQWVYNVPFDHSRYIYYKRNGKNITCFCTECKEEFIQREDNFTNKFIDMMGLTSPHKIIRYVNEQSRPGFKAKLVLSDWCDYISQCKKLKFDLNNTFVIFPEKLQDKHEECSLMISSKGFAKYAVRVVKAYKKLNIAFGYADKNYLVRPVDSVDEIVKEGHRQRHCVASAHYVEGIACGDKAIMVIRNVDKPNEPFYTMEINLRTLSVIQCRGFRNCDMTAEVRKFVDKWKTKKLVDNGKRHTAKSA